MFDPRTTEIARILKPDKLAGATPGGGHDVQVTVAIQVGRNRLVSKRPVRSYQAVRFARRPVLSTSGLPSPLKSPMRIVRDSASCGHHGGGDRENQ
jgi:hypothetical protein